MAQAEIIVFTAQGCGACQRVKEYLREKGVPFEERSVEDPEHRRQLVEDYRRMATPTTVAGEEIIVGFDRARLEALVARQAGAAPSA